jgi:hypothetical protein
MHRAGVDRAFGQRLRGFALRRVEIFRGIGRELRAATGRAEVVRMAVVGVAVRRGVRIDRHAAHRIERGIRGRRAMRGVMMVAVPGVLVNGFRHFCLSPTRLK